MSPARTGSRIQRGLRFQRAMLGLCAVLFGYMLGLVTWAVQLEMEYSVPQWILVGLLVAASAALLTFQILKVRRLHNAIRRDS